MCAKSCLTLTLWAAPLSMGFSGQEYWSWWSFPSPGDLPLTQESDPCLLYWQAGSLPLSHQGSLIEIQARFEPG